MLAFSAAFGVQAKYIDPSQALERLGATEVRKVKSNLKPAKMLYTWYDEAGVPQLYLFTYSGNTGFMLLSADDAAAPLLGYSETNDFMVGEEGPNIQNWLQSYRSQIDYARNLAPYETMAVTRADQWSPVEPMLKTTWGQDSPYNRRCPVVNGRVCPTGCVATSMAQVMKYWEYPKVGKGNISYQPEGLDYYLSINLNETTFEWDKMLDSYKGSYNWNDSQSVAILMQACGYAAQMQYSPGISGAYTSNIIPAMTNNFGYDQGISLQRRSTYSDQQTWDKMIYDNLVNVGPVIYGGNTTTSGHSFVCDGYDGNGLFHINWGWEGLSDGYFKLNALNPREYGTGGGNDKYTGYNLMQDAVIGITPPVGRLTVEDISIDNAADDSGNVKGWGYTYRIQDPHNILLSISVRIAGGQISSPLFVSVYETDPDTKVNGNMVLSTTLDNSLKAGEGLSKVSSYIHFNNFDPSKLYTLVVAYNLKGQRTNIGSLRMAASSGVDEIIGEDSDLAICRNGNVVSITGSENVSLGVYDISGTLLREKTGGNPEIDITDLPAGIYIAVAKASGGTTRTLKLLR